MTLLRLALLAVAFWVASCTSFSAQEDLLRQRGKAGSAPLTTTEMGYARTAWRYFVVNEDPATGLVKSVNNYSSMTLWDEGAYLLAIVSAYRLGLISRADALDRGGRALDSLDRMPLFVGRLPNKAYNTSTLQMTDYANRPTPNGVGWSALDVMRMVTGLLVLSAAFPELDPQARMVLGRWDLGLLVQDGRFQGNAVSGRATGGTLQEGRIGYEQYAASAGLRIGLPVQGAVKFRPILRYQTYDGARLPGDIRTAGTHGISSVTTSEPFILQALEFGWPPEFQQVAEDVYRAQIFRYATTGHLTALSEDHIKGIPYFAYNGVLVDHQPFVTVTADRTDVSDKRSLSTKASFGWWAIFRDPYSKALMNRIRHLQSDRGWYAGIFESTGLPNKALSLNTNAVILEALHYKAFGPLFHRQANGPDFRFPALTYLWCIAR